MNTYSKRKTFYSGTADSVCVCVRRPVHERLNYEAKKVENDKG